MKFVILTKHTLRRRYTVEAETEEDAKKKMGEYYDSGPACTPKDFVLDGTTDSDDFEIIDVAEA